MAKIFQKLDLLEKCWSAFKHSVGGSRDNRALLVYIHREVHREFRCQLPKLS